MKVNIIGLNNFGKVHLEAWSKLDVEIEITERKKEVADDLRSKYEISRVHDSLESAFSSDADIFDIVLPHDMHRDVAIRAMEAGKHVIIEKPIATEVDDAKAMIRRSRDLKRKFMVADQYYFEPSVWKIIDLVKEGRIGKLHTIVIRDQRKYNWHGWRAKASVMGGGPLIDGGIHFVDTMLNLGGDYTKIRSVYYKSVETIEEPDTVEAIFQFKNGSNGLFFYSWGYPFAPKVPAFEVVGSEGSIVEDLSTKPVGFDAPKGKRAYGDPVLNGNVIDLGRHDIFVDEVSGFMKSVIDDTPAPFDPDLALRDLICVKDIYASMI